MISYFSIRFNSIQCDLWCRELKAFDLCFEVQWEIVLTMGLPLKNATFYMPYHRVIWINILANPFDHEINFSRRRWTTQQQKNDLIFSIYMHPNANTESIYACVTCVQLSTFARKIQNHTLKECVRMKAPIANRMLSAENEFFDILCRKWYEWKHGVAAVIEINFYHQAEAWRSWPIQSTKHTFYMNKWTKQKQKKLLINFSRWTKT